MSKKVVIIGVGNSGTKLLGILVNELLKGVGYPAYYYEPLYWKGTQGEANIVPDKEAIAEHVRFPLLPDENSGSWEWLDTFIDNLEGLAKFIRLGSRINLLLKHDVKIIWITRELYSYLASMQKNFPRCLPNAGWHHRPGEYDDFGRLKNIYKNSNLRDEEEYRIEVEAAWWHMHNNEMMEHSGNQKIYRIRYEDLCMDPVEQMKKIAGFIDVPFVETETYKDIYLPPKRKMEVFPANILAINAIGEKLNKTIYDANICKKILA